ncbi:MAG TPA: MraY family glycosyltransferase [Thermodesulfovibrionales bacterium]|nr:MraY family glycosyltransferase [Thermodesulfovibrionales bacterium]
MTVRLVYYFISYFAVAFLIALALTPVMRSLSFRVGAVDRGAGRRAHSGIIPRLGGLAIFFAFIVPVSFSLTRGEWDLVHEKMLGVLIASTIVILVGVKDDIRGTRVWSKLLAEIIAAAVIYAWGIRIDVISNPFGGDPVTLGWMSLPVTVLWVIIVTNAFNLIDGLDGLAAGTGIFITATFFALAGGDIHLQLTYVILAGSLFGFLRYNFPPATIFMGDSGSLFLGFFLGATSIISAYKATAIVTIMIPIIAFGLPLMDMFYAVLRRYYRGVPLGEADKEHIHHKLLEKGLSKKKVLLLLYSVNIVIMLAVLLIVGRQWNLDLLGLILLCVLGVLGLRLLGYVEFIPFVRGMLRSHSINRKRKYFDYVIDKFKRDAARSNSFEDLWVHLTELAREYNFSYMEIFLGIPSIKNPAFLFRNGEAQNRSLILSFPILDAEYGYLGDVLISKMVDDEYFLCMVEMVRAVSEEVCRFARKYSALSPNSPQGAAPAA